MATAARAQVRAHDRETDEGKRLYRARAGLCEWTNARFAAHFGLRQFLVRGIEKTSCVALLYAITTNLTQHLATLASWSQSRRLSTPRSSVPAFLPS